MKAVFVALGVFLLARGVEAAQVTFPIQDDTYLDSQKPSTNFGTAGTVKTLINSSDGSICRGLFQLPPDVSLYPTDQVQKATVFFYVWQDNTTNRNITLYPLTRSFAEGSGSGAVPADGATWTTYDGANAWTSAGGDFDTNFPVVGAKEPILDPDLHDRFFSWDITALLRDEQARSNLVNYGAILQIDEVPVPASGMPRAPFTSSDDLGYAEAFRPHVQLLIVPRTADVACVAVKGGGLLMSVTNCTPYVTNRVERTFDLQQADGWTLVTNLVTTGCAASWVMPLPSEGTSVFYRVGTE